jgi:hypothetical protein
MVGKLCPHHAMKIAKEWIGSESAKTVYCRRRPLQETQAESVSFVHLSTPSIASRLADFA